MSLAARFRKAVTSTALSLELVAGWIVLIVAVAVTVNAIARYGFAMDLALITEAGGFVFLVVTFLALASAYLAGQHVSVELLDLVAPERVVSVMRGYVVPVLSLIFMIGMTVASGIMTLRYFHTGRVTIGLYPMPLWIFMAVVPLGSALFSLALISDLVDRIRGGADIDAHPGQTDDGL